MLEPSGLTLGRPLLECVGVQGLWPCGEGAGHAGGIVSAAVDGLKVASALTQSTEILASIGGPRGDNPTQGLLTSGDMWTNAVPVRESY